MKQLTIYALSFLISTSLLAKDPIYASNKTKEIIQKMIEAHGGMEAWKNANTFSYDNTMFSSSLGEVPFWVSEVTIDKKTRRVYQDWPIHQSSMSYNGKEAWSVDWKIGNAPKFEALFFYYFLNLPWLTQDSNVTLGEVTKIKHAAFENEVYVIDMGFTEKPAVGKTKKDRYKLYIDSNSYLLIGYEYKIGYGYMLDLFRFPADKELFGPMFRINKSFTTVDGLIYPNIMETSNTDQTQVYGNHAIYNYSHTIPFDETRMNKPSNAVMDESSYLRKSEQ